MNARRDSSDEPEAGSSGSRALLVGAVLFAAAATGLLVLTDEQKWLRLGIVAALWAALVGAFLAARYRRQLADQRDAVAERQEIYELELEREIAARREHELEVEAAAKRRAEESSRDDIAALRGELEKMQQTLESLLGGEFLVERYALRAESTRMRSLGDDRSLAVRNDVKHLPAAQPKAAEVIIPPVVREAETEMIERIREVHQKPRQQPLRAEPRIAAPSQPAQPRRPERPAARTEWPTPEPAKPVKRPEPPKRPEPAQPAAAARQQQERPTRIVEHPAEVSDRWFVKDGPGDATPQPRRPEQRSEQRRPEQPRTEQPRRPEPQRPVEPPSRRPAPAWGDADPEWTRREQAEAARRAHHAEAEAAARAFEASAPFGSQAERTSWLAQYNKPQAPEPTYSSRAYVPPIRQEPQAQPEPVLTDRPRRGTDHRAERSGFQLPVEPEESGGGRRRRAEGQPSWQETVGRGRPEEPSGSHAAGRSVSELLANHGVDSSPRRRRRREE